ncbi:dispanin subfamily A member 2b-like [Chiloscyllium punctatum]|uniref:dispanin subfamily A member 2b-like n=1 Tax=Chiloscyllium punctatum TaxID=137246 RepID=UPI003B63AD3B
MAKDSSSTSSDNIPVRDYLVWSLFNLSYMNFFCLGLVAVLFSVKSRDRKMDGDFDQARTYARKARILNIVASVLSSLVFIAFIAMAGAGMFQTK